ENIIYLDPRPEYENDELFFDDVLEQGRLFLTEHPGEMKKIRNSVTKDDVANICYTSGTTADPKGIMLSHRNYTANVEQSLTLMTIPEHYCTLLILPWDHSFAHTAGIYAVIASGASMASIQVGS